MNKTPKVTILMPIYNASLYLRAAIESMLAQTFKDFEFLILDDGSIDDSVSIVKSYTDTRIKLVKLEHRGLVEILNYGISEAKGDYLARMDADDISLPNRLGLQTKFLNTHPDHALVGTTIEAIDLKDSPIAGYPEPTEHKDLVRGMTIRNVFSHGSIMARLEIMKKVGGYDSKAKHAEDYDLWTRIARVGKVANLPELLYKWRVNPSGISLTKVSEQQYVAKAVADREWDFYVTSHRLPGYSLEEVYKKRSAPAADKYWAKRRSTIAGVHAQIGNRYLLSGNRKLAGKEIFQALVLSPLRIRNYFYLMMLILPSRYIPEVEPAIKSLVLKLRGKIIK